MDTDKHTGKSYADFAAGLLLLLWVYEAASLYSDATFIRTDISHKNSRDFECGMFIFCTCMIILIIRVTHGKECEACAMDGVSTHEKNLYD